MNDRDYWTKRYLQLKVKGEKSSLLFEQQTQAVMDQINTQLNRRIIEWYKKYAKISGTDFATAAQLLKKAHSSDWRTTLEEFRRLAIAGGHDKELDLQYFESQVKRLELLQQQLQQIITPNLPPMQSAMANSLETTYTDTYLHASYLNSAVTGSGMESFANFNERAVKIAVNQPWAPDGSDFSRRLWGNMVDHLPTLLTQKVTESLVLGISPKKLAHELSRANAAFNENNLHRLIHSETAHVVEEATFKSYDDTGVEKYRFTATLESRTCPVCGELDDQVFLLTERKPGINYPTIHVWCRCTTVAEMTGWPPHGKRWSKDPITGEKKLVDHISFNEWKKQVFGEGNQVAKTEPPVLKKETTRPIQPSEQDKNSLGVKSKFTTLNLTDDQIEAVQNYYQGDAYDINSRLREDGESTWTSDQLDAALAGNTAKQSMTLYRKVNSGQLQALKDQYFADNPDLQFPNLKEGSTFSDAGFMSTSKSMKQDRFDPFSGAFEGDTELVIKIPKGSHALDIQPIADKALTEGVKSEEEVLLPRNAKFKVTKVENHDLNADVSVGTNAKTYSNILIDKTKRVTLELVTSESSDLASARIKTNQEERNGISNQVNWDEIGKQHYHDKFDQLSLPKSVRESAYDVAKEMLHHRDGQQLEDLYAIDNRSGEIVARNVSATDERHTGFNSDQYEKILQNANSVVLLHNHPQGWRPSGQDIVTLYENRELTNGSIIVGHDGSIHSIKLSKRTLNVKKLYDKYFAFYKSTGYTNGEAETFATDKLYEMGAVDYEHFE